MADPEFVSAVAPVVSAFERIGVPYYVTGSVVSLLKSPNMGSRS